jgi:hypothetical protein
VKSVSALGDDATPTIADWAPAPTFDTIPTAGYIVDDE